MNSPDLKLQNGPTVFVEDHDLSIQSLHAMAEKNADFRLSHFIGLPKFNTSVTLASDPAVATSALEQAKADIAKLGHCPMDTVHMRNVIIST